MAISVEVTMLNKKYTRLGMFHFEEDVQSFLKKESILYMEKF